MRKLPLLFLVAILLLVAGVQATAYTTWSHPATGIMYSRFYVNVYNNATGADIPCGVRYDLNSDFSTYQNEGITVCTAGSYEHFQVDVPEGWWGRVLYYKSYGATVNNTDVHTVTLLSGTIIETGPGGVTSNRFNVSAYAINGTEVWFEYGSRSGIRNWKSPVWDVTDVDMTLTLEGAPMYGGETVYYTVCDDTGCTAENHTTLLAVTTIPTIPAAKQLWTNITRSRFSPTSIGEGLLGAYTQVAPTTIAIGAAAMFILLGFWFRTKTTRTALMIGVLLAAFLASASSGLMLGLPVIWSAVAVGFLAAGLTGIIWSIIHR